MLWVQYRTVQHIFILLLLSLLLFIWGLSLLLILLLLLVLGKCSIIHIIYVWILLHLLVLCVGNYSWTYIIIYLIHRALLFVLFFMHLLLFVCIDIVLVLVIFQWTAWWVSILWSQYVRRLFITIKLPQKSIGISINQSLGTVSSPCSLYLSRHHLIPISSKVPNIPLYTTLK